MNNNYYESDIRTSRQEDILLSIDDDRQRLLGLIKYWREECFKQDKQLEEYKNAVGKVIGLIYDYQMNDKDNLNYEEMLYFLKNIGSDK